MQRAARPSDIANSPRIVFLRGSKRTSLCTTGAKGRQPQTQPKIARAPPGIRRPCQATSACTRLLVEGSADGPAPSSATTPATAVEPATWEHGCGSSAMRVPAATSAFAAAGPRRPAQTARCCARHLQTGTELQTRRPGWTFPSWRGESGTQSLKPQEATEPPLEGTTPRLCLWGAPGPLCRTSRRVPSRAI